MHGRNLTVSDVHCLLLDEPTCSNVEVTERQTLEQCVSDCNVVESAEATESPLSMKENTAGSCKRNLFTGAEVLAMLSESENDDDLLTASDSTDSDSDSDYDLSDPDACNYAYSKDTSTSESDGSSAEEMTETCEQASESISESLQGHKRGRGSSRGHGSSRGRGSSRDHQVQSADLEVTSLWITTSYAVQAFVIAFIARLHLLQSCS